MKYALQMKTNMVLKSFWMTACVHKLTAVWIDSFLTFPA